MTTGPSAFPLTVEDPSPMDCETFDDVAEGVPRFIASYNTRRPHSAPEYLGPAPFEDRSARAPVKTPA